VVAGGWRERFGGNFFLGEMASPFVFNAGF